MLSSMASGAILSKTRAMFGRRLHSEDYAALAQKRDVASAAAYLASLSAYRELLDGKDLTGIHRHELEALLRHRHFFSFEALCRYELSIGEKFSKYILLKTEIELITETVSRILSPRNDPAFLTASPYLDKRLSIDISAMGQAQTYDELLNAVKNSVFWAPLKRLGWNPTGELLTYEVALFAEFYNRIFAVINDSLSGEARNTLVDLFESRIDLENLVRIVRMKSYFPGASPEMIRTSLIPHGNVMGSAAVKLAECKNSGAVLSEASKMKQLRRKLELLDRCRRIDELPDRYTMKRCRHEIYFSPHPAVVMISYLNISEIEISNIVKIIEGIRYGMRPDDITEMLILHEKRGGETQTYAKE